MRFKKKSEECSEKITNMSSYEEKHDNDVKEGICNVNKSFSVDIETDLKRSFNGLIISSSQEKNFICYYTDIFNEVYSLNKKLDFFV